MTYRLALSRQAARKIENLPEKVATAVLEFMTGALLENPRRVGGPLNNQLAGQYSARRGNEWRIRYTIDDNSSVVRVLDVSHRSDAYYTPGAGRGSIS